MTPHPAALVSEINPISEAEERAPCSFGIQVLNKDQYPEQLDDQVARDYRPKTPPGFAYSLDR
ncbi:MAG: hypothetical protein ACP5O0_08320 [Acidimicrobiales bacterium]